MKDNKLRSPLGIIEDDNTFYTFTDWTSASKMRNYINPLLRVDVGVLRDLTEGTPIVGYQITVYDINTQVTIYRFYVNYIADNVFSFTTEEAINFLNRIGFRCEYTEPIVITEELRVILESFQSLGYTHIQRIENTAKFNLLTILEEDLENIIKITPMDEVLLKDVNLYDFRFIGQLPVSIEELLN